jgi:hypothetical protein
VSNISVDLKVIETHAPSVARAAGVSEDRVIAGLVRLWHRCWSTAKATLQRSEVAGAFGPERLDEVIGALEVDFLEKQGDGSFRVRGADQYLRIKEGRRKGAEKTNRALAERRSSVAPASLPNALSPNTEHRTPNTDPPKKHAATEPAEPQVAAFHIEPPDLGVIDSWSKEDFWKAAELFRRELGYPPQKWPHPIGLTRFWGEARAVAEVRELAVAFKGFAASDHWRKAQPPAPFAGFMSQWNNFLPARSA